MATGFTNTAFPFINYLVGDSATWAPPDFKCPCGRNSQVIYSIDGRNEDYVLASNGNRIDAIAIGSKDVVFITTIYRIYDLRVATTRTFKIRWSPGSRISYQVVNKREGCICKSSCQDFPGVTTVRVLSGVMTSSPH